GVVGQGARPNPAPGGLTRNVRAIRGGTDRDRNCRHSGTLPDRAGRDTTVGESPMYKVPCGKAASGPATQPAAGSGGGEIRGSGAMASVAAALESSRPAAS